MVEQQPFDLNAIRRLLLTAFNAQELRELFCTGSLVNVPGLDIEQLTDSLLEAGCSQTSALKSIPLVLKERNDQVTFDRL